jgi:uncharacterized membrane protein
MSDIYKPPESELRQVSGTAQDGSVERTLAGDFEFDPFALIGEAFRLTSGIKAPVLVGMLLAGVASYVAQLLTSALTEAESGIDAVVLPLVGNAVQLAVSAPFAAGVLWVVLRRAAGRTVEFDDLFTPFRHVPSLVGVALLTWALTTIGFLLLIIPGIYLAVAYVLAVPVLIDRGVSPWQALETSRRVVTRCWWRMLATLLLLGAMLTVSALMLVVPLIWTLPASVMTIALVYRNLCGIQAAGR